MRTWSYGVWICELLDQISILDCKLSIWDLQGTLEQILMPQIAKQPEKRNTRDVKYWMSWTFDFTNLRRKILLPLQELKSTYNHNQSGQKEKIFNKVHIASANSNQTNYCMHNRSVNLEKYFELFSAHFEPIYLLSGSTYFFINIENLLKQLFLLRRFAHVTLSVLFWKVTIVSIKWQLLQKVMLDN